MKDFNAKKLTFEELVKINAEALKNFKEGDYTLMEERKKRCPDGSCDDLFVQEVAERLIAEIIEASVESIWEGVGLAHFAGERYRRWHE